MKQLIILSAAFLTLLSSCNYTSGSGNMITQKRTVGNFTGIAASNAIDVEVTIGTATEVRVEADDNIMKHVITDVSGDGVLKIKIENMVSLNDTHVKVYVTTPGLKSISASSSADVKVNGVIKYDGKISFDASSSGDIEATVDAPEVDAEASSSGSIILSGKTKNYKAEASSSGDIKSAELLSENTNASANSAGSTDVHASVTLNADASSGGDVTYRGAATVKKDVSSGGSVEKKD
jgi:Putative auto-transporter adhesin, head GIN domain